MLGSADHGAEGPALGTEKVRAVSGTRLADGPSAAAAAEAVAGTETETETETEIAVAAERVAEEIEEADTEERSVPHVATNRL